ncbi:hypothetical protein [Marinobacterium sp. LSUCC0821]|uniref:hypothetical protein n=1 Tax=Marinobacterium sp. LSUCC0821 TaxID=2668067 RepID=UPI0014515EE5|nr:hypothetical protein [Marinobacterium sp. LSUCC0821]QJD72063.1 hypothetical protein HH196_10300 [Marinobacterium sp. LSUCC0821]
MDNTKINPVLEYLGYGDLPFPYTDPEFLSKAEDELVTWKDLPDSYKLAALCHLEFKFLYPNRFVVGFSKWLISGHPIHVLIDFETIEKAGIRVTPAMQKILAIATSQYLYDQTPLNNPTNKTTAKRVEIQNQALRLAAQLEIYIGNSRSLACSKASNYYKNKYPDAVGISPDRLKKLLQKPPRHFLESVKKDYQSSDKKSITEVIQSLVAIPDIEGSF